MAGTASQEGGQDCSEVLAAAGRLHIPETRTDTVPPSSDFFADLHTCSRPATFRKFTSQQLRKIFRSRHGFKLDRHDNIRVIIFRRVYPCIYRPCLHPVCRDWDQDSLFLLYRSNHRDALPEELRASSVDLRDKFVRFAGLGEKVWNTFSHRCNITCKTVTDRAKNTEGYITIPALHTSKIAPV